MKSFEEIAKTMTESGHPMCKEAARKIHDKALENIIRVLNVPENKDARDDFAEIVSDDGITVTHCRIIVNKLEEL